MRVDTLSRRRVRPRVLSDSDLGMPSDLVFIGSDTHRKAGSRAASAAVAASTASSSEMALLFFGDSP